MRMFAKLFSRITESSLMDEDVPVRYCFVMLLAIADPQGYVVGTDVAIARRMNVPLDEFKRCLGELMKPDEDSNSKEEEGRRVIQSDAERGYFLVNYRKYRDTRDEEQRRDYMRDYMRNRRNGKDVASVNNCKHGKHSLANADADESKTEIQKDRENPSKKEPAHRSVAFAPPTVGDCKAAFANAGSTEAEAEKFFNYYGANGWRVGKNPMRSLPHAIGGWIARWREQSPSAGVMTAKESLHSEKSKYGF